MSDISPEMISEIATRLYRQLPGVSSVPQPKVSMPHAPEPPIAAVSPVRMPTAVPGNPASSSHAPSPGSHASSSGVDPWGATNSAIPVGSTTTSSSSSNQVRNPEGLKAFVQRIRAPHSQNSGNGGFCEDGGGLNHIQQVFAKRAANAPSRPFDVNAIRQDFPILKQLIHGRPLAWFDNAATTQKPNSVIDALSKFYANDNSNIHRGAHTLAARATDAYEEARQKIQRFVGAGSPKEIIYVRGTTEGINLVTQTFGRKFLQPGDEIVLSTLEHHANIVPWQAIAREKGAVLRVIPVNDRGEIQMEQYQSLLGPRTKVVALTQASNSLGTILPVGEMTALAKRYGAKVLIDGAQSVAHIPVNVQDLGCDFFVFSGHKIFGPTGIGAVFAKEELQELMPPWQGGGNMIKNVTFEETTFSDPPGKFEAGTPNIADAVGLGVALDYVNRLGLTNIAKYEHELLGYATEQLSRIQGLQIFGTARDKVSVISFVMRGRGVQEIGRLLDLEGIAVRAGHHCAQPSLRRFGLDATVRPSFSLYNTTEEIDRLSEALRRIQRF